MGLGLGFVGLRVDSSKQEFAVGALGVSVRSRTET